MATHVYDWLKARGYWISFHDERAPGERRPTHLMLDGGKAAVPEEATAAFLNAYVTSLVAFPTRRPCIVELRTPVFRMFVDLDTRFASLEAAERAATDGLPSVMRCLAAEVDGTATVCVSSASKQERGGVFKRGFHVVWPDVLVTAGTALELRKRFVARLEAEVPAAEVGACDTGWDGVVDAVVYKSSGLRMPWSAKGREDGRAYEPRWTLTAEGLLRPQTVPMTVSSMRDAMRRLSVRTFGQPTMQIESLNADDAQPSATATAYTAKSLAAYADVLPKLAEALPVQFLGQKFTALLATEHCFMLRSTARYCFNLGRAHNTNNVYFVLTRRGVCQRCYCRCETTEGRKYGMCKDFSSPCWQVPRDVLDAFFPAEEPPPQQHSSVSAMPSRAAKSYWSLDTLVSRSRPAKRGRRM